MKIFFTEKKRRGGYIVIGGREESAWNPVVIYALIVWPHQLDHFDLCIEHLTYFMDPVFMHPGEDSFICRVRVHIHRFWNHEVCQLLYHPDLSKTFSELQTSELPNPRALIILFLNYSKILYNILKVGEDTNHLWLPVANKRPSPKKWPYKCREWRGVPRSLWWHVSLPHNPLQSRSHSPKARWRSS